MNFKTLLEDKKIEKLKERQEPGFSLAEKDLEVAERVFSSKDYDWAMNIAYNSVLRASRELMFFLGYRSIGKEHHKNVFKFLRKLELNQEPIEYFDKIRIKRNKNIYGDVEDISESSAKETMQKAKAFVQEIRTFVQEIRTKEKKKGGKN